MRGVAPTSLAVLLAGLNAWIITEWFSIEYLDLRDSIEGAFIGLARYVVENPGQTGWFPLWYNGIPFENAYPPLLHHTVAAAAWLGGISPARGYHVTVGAFYCAGPVTLFLLAYSFSRKLFPSALAGVLFSLLSPALLVLPSALQDIGSLAAPRRFYVLARYGGGPQTVALALLPVAVVLFNWALRKPRPHTVFLAAVAVAAVALTNWFGAFSLAWALLACLSAQDRLERRDFLVAAACGVWAYALASVWLPPATVTDILRNAQISHGQ